MQDEGVADYAESEFSSDAMNRANELVNTEYCGIIAAEGSEDDEIPLEPRPRRATPVMARFIKHVLHEDLDRIDNSIVLLCCFVVVVLCC